MEGNVILSCDPWIFEVRAKVKCLITTAKFKWNVQFNLISFNKQIETQFVFASHLVSSLTSLLSSNLS